MSKIKKRIKRAIKKAAPLVALAAGAAALGRRRRNQANVELALPMSNMFTRPNMRDIAGPVIGSKIGNRGRGMNLNRFTSGPAMNPSGDVFGMDATGDIQYAMPAKGGQIIKTEKGGVARRPKKKKIQIKGFGKARK